MNREHDQLEAVFNAAAELSGPEREIYLARACGDDAELRQRVEKLLRALERAGGFLTQAERVTAASGPAVGVSGSASPTVVLPILEKPGDHIGRYKLREQIGEGGCGVVYVAEQEEPVRRRVALKVIKLGMDSRSVIARFEAERQALALMDHPNIAKVLDAGATETGRPFFVMELVRGNKITDYCDQNNLPTRERLDLFIQVCHAMQHAHQKGIIHRDIKPSNILVTLHDGVPVPKVIDFGIAKATTQQRLTDKTVYTALEQFIGTPAYMSPEQAEMSGLDIDTRSDIYALGVLLYELLTGKTPFDAKTLLAAGLDEMRRIIREQEPVRPSTRLATMAAGDLTTTARHRRAEAPKLIHLLQGDLDWIVIKALEKDRTRRYETANGLALDIERHLKHEPVTARPPSTAYRMQKFVRRNKLMVTASGAVVAVLVFGIVISTWQAVRASRLRVKAEANEQKALQAQTDEAKQRRAAEAEKLLARQHAYAADMKIADLALGEGNLGQVMSLLRRHIPEPDASDLRGIEWRYLWCRCQGDQVVALPHKGVVNCVDVSSDGRWVATECEGQFSVWNVATRTRVQDLGPAALGSTRQHVAFDPKGRFLATAAPEGVVLWDTRNWRRMHTLPCTNAVVDVSGDGMALATFGEEGLGVWDTANWQARVGPELLRIDADGHRTVALNSDGSLLAASLAKGYVFATQRADEIALWHLPDGRRLIQAKDVTEPLSLDLSSDGNWLAVGTWSGHVYVWAVREGQALPPVAAHHGLVRGLAFSPDGRTLVSGGNDQQIHFWKSGTTEPLFTLRGHLSELWGLRFSADEQWLISASKDATARMWHTAKPEVPASSFAIPPNRMVGGLTLDGRRFVTIDPTDWMLEEWETETGGSVRKVRLQEADRLRELADPLRIQRTTFIMSWENLWSAAPADPQRLCFVAVANAPWAMVAASCDGRVYAWGQESGGIVYSDKIAKTPLISFGQYDLRLSYGMEASPHGNRLVIWDLKTNQRKATYGDCLFNSPLCFPLLGDLGLVAYPSTNRSIVVRNFHNHRLVASIQHQVVEAIRAMAFSSDGSLLAAGSDDGTAQIWMVATATPAVAPLVGHLSGIDKLNFSSDGKTLVTYSDDRTARLWNVATGQEMLSGLPLNHPLGYNVSLNLLLEDGNGILEAAGTNRFRILRLPTLNQIDAAEKVPPPKP